jgi:N-acetylneuraminic acid mutarotase
MASLPVPVRAAAAAVAGNRIYVVGGTGVGGRTSVFQILDVPSGVWSYGPNLPVATDWGSATWVASRLHFLGGVTDQVAASPQHWVYEASSDEWTAGPPLPSASAGSAIATHDSKIFIFGGIEGPGVHSDHTLIYDVSTSDWSTGQPVPSARINWVGAALDQRILVVGGGTPGVDTTGELLSYALGQDAWTALTPIPLPREAHGASAVGSLFCAAGGRLAAMGNFNTPFADTSCYDAETEKWMPLPALPIARQELVMVSMGDFIIAVGGRDEFGSPMADLTRLRLR